MVTKITRLSQLVFTFLFSTQSNAANSFFVIQGDMSSLRSDSFDIKKHVANYRERTALLAIANPDLIVLRGNTNEKVVALTFDDGPDIEITTQILNILATYGAKATFFVIGNRVIDPKYTDVVMRTKDEGHAILSHGLSHPRYSQKKSDGARHYMPEDEILADIAHGETLLTSVIGEHAQLMRPPYGDVNEVVIRVLRSVGIKAILGSIDSLDWAETSTADIIVNNVIDNMHPGAIVFMHSAPNKEYTVEALPVILRTLILEGYRFVTIPELLALENS